MDVDRWMDTIVKMDELSTNIYSIWRILNWCTLLAFRQATEEQGLLQALPSQVS
jgi:hypothetical protein